MTTGIALSVKANLGVSPVSSIPYTMTCIFGLEMGKGTILFHSFLVLLQIILLRKNFKLINLAQVLVGIVFGYFTTFCNWGVSQVFPKAITNYPLRILLLILSIIFIAWGLFFYVPANIMPLAGEGFISALSEITKIQFHKCKIIFDMSLVVISFACCMIFIHSIGSVGLGTLLAAFFVGFVLGFLNKWFGNWRDKILKTKKLKD